MKDLMELVKKYPSDKLGHGYLPFYQEYLPEKVDSFLEIGVLKGHSARLFDDFYENKPEFHLLDLFEEPGNLTEREARALGFVTHKGSQTDLTLLNSIRRKFQIIEEDCSHNCPDQLITLRHCFFHLLKPSGIFFLEDVHSSHDPFYYGGEVKNFSQTPLAMFYNYLSNGKIVNPYFQGNDATMFESLIDWVKIVSDDKLIIIKKK